MRKENLYFIMIISDSHILKSVTLSDTSVSAALFCILQKHILNKRMLFIMMSCLFYCDYSPLTCHYYHVICQTLLAIYTLFFMDYYKEKEENIKG